MIGQTQKKIAVIVDATNLITVNFKAGNGKVEFDLFCRQMKFVEEHLKPSVTIAAFDSENSFRKEMSPEYKANRGDKEQHLVESLEKAEKEIADRGWVVAKLPGFEADDILASCAKVAVDRLNMKCVLISRDKDINQLLRSGQVSILKKLSIAADANEPFEFMTADDCENKFGISPEQWIGYQMLVGDSGDNIKGVEGIGDKTAIKLMKAAGSVEKVLMLPEIAPTKRLVQNINKFIPRADEVRDLVTLRDNLPVADYFR